MWMFETKTGHKNVRSWVCVCLWGRGGEKVCVGPGHNNDGNNLAALL